MRTFYIELTLRFLQDVDFNAMEQALNWKANKKNTVSQSKGPAGHKYAKMIFKTKKYTDFYPDVVLEKFLLATQEKLKSLPQILQKNNGEAKLCLVVNYSPEWPPISLSTVALKILAENQIEFEVDSF